VLNVNQFVAHFEEPEESVVEVLNRRPSIETCRRRQGLFATPLDVVAGAPPIFDCLKLRILMFVQCKAITLKAATIWL
jgi:hypothetical protein